MGTQISKEESNYVKLVMVLTRIAPRAVRSYFDREIHPDCLQKTLHDNWIKLHNLKTLNNTQKKLLFPLKDDPRCCSKSFDTTLMILLLRHVCEIQISDKRPVATCDISAASDHLSTIKYIRNVVNHTENGLLTTTDFDDYWKAIVTASVSLGGVIFQKECDELLKKELIDLQLKNLSDGCIAEMLEENMNAAIEQILSMEARMMSDEVESYMNDCTASDENQQYSRLSYDTKKEVMMSYAELNLVNTTELSVEDCSFDELHSFLLKSKTCDAKETTVFKTISNNMDTEQNNWNDLENLLHLAKPMRYSKIVKLLIDTLKIGGEKSKIIMKLVDQKIKSCLERFGKRLAVIKIKRRNLDKTEGFNDNLPADHKKAIMRIEGLTEEEEDRVLNVTIENSSKPDINSSFEIHCVKKGSIQIFLSAGSNVFMSPITVRNAIHLIIRWVLDVGNVNTNIEGNRLNIEVIFDRDLTKDQLGMIQQMTSLRFMDKHMDRESIEEENRILLSKNVDLEERLKQLNGGDTTKDMNLDAQTAKLVALTNLIIAEGDTTKDMNLDTQTAILVALTNLIIAEGDTTKDMNRDAQTAILEILGLPGVFTEIKATSHADNIKKICKLLDSTKDCVKVLQKTLQDCFNVLQSTISLQQVHNLYSKDKDVRTTTGHGDKSSLIPDHEIDTEPDTDSLKAIRKYLQTYDKSSLIPDHEIDTEPDTDSLKAMRKYLQTYEKLMEKVLAAHSEKLVVKVLAAHSVPSSIYESPTDFTQEANDAKSFMQVYLDLARDKSSLIPDHAIDTELDTDILKAMGKCLQPYDLRPLLSDQERYVNLREDLTRRLEQVLEVYGVKRISDVLFGQMFEDRNKKGGTYTNDSLPVENVLISNGFFPSTSTLDGATTFITEFDHGKNNHLHWNMLNEDNKNSRILPRMRL